MICSAITTSYQNSYCNDKGFIQLDITNPKYLIAWTGSSETTTLITNLEPGTYYASVTDTGTTETCYFEFILTGDTCCCYGCLDFSYVCSIGDGGLVLPYIEIISVTGGTPPYSYSLTGLEHQTDTSFKNLSSGYHVVHVKDSSTCTAYKSVYIPKPPIINGSIIKCDITTETNISVNLNLDTGIINKTYIDDTGNVWCVSQVDPNINLC